MKELKSMKEEKPKHHYGDDVAIKRAGLSIRSPFAVMVLAPFQLPLILALGVVSIVFTIWPDALQHTAISFETRGVLHHIWHYSLLFGSVLTVVGMFWTDARRLRVELSGLFILMGSVMMNVIAQVASAAVGGEDGASGLGMALRFGILVGMASRAFVIVAAPVVSVKAPPGKTATASLPAEVVEALPKSEE